MKQELHTRARVQIVWGVALVAAGIGVIYRIPHVMPKIIQIEQFSAASGFVYFCFYMMAVILIAGGGKKIFTHYKILKKENPDNRS